MANLTIQIEKCSLIHKFNDHIAQYRLTDLGNFVPIIYCLQL